MTTIVVHEIGTFFDAFPPPLALAVAIIGIVWLMLILGHAALKLCRDFRSFMRGE